MSKAAKSVVLFLAIAMATPAVAADGVWVVDQVGAVSASVVNSAGNMSLIVGCAAPNVALALSGSGVEVDPAGDVGIKIGAKAYPLTFGKAKSSVLLNDRTDGAAGITDELYAALRTGKSAQLTGTAFAAAPAESLSFPLTGSGDALKTVRDSCGAAPAPAN
jgi:invasion protein IalB